MFELLSMIFTAGTVEGDNETASDQADQGNGSEAEDDLNINDFTIDDETAVGELRNDHEKHLKALLDSTETAEEPLSLGRRHAKRGVSPEEFARTYETAVETLIEDTLEEQDVSDHVARNLQSEVKAVLDDMADGLGQYETNSQHADAILSIEEVLEAIPQPVYILDAEHTTVGWNYGHTQLVGMTREEAIGKHSKDSVIKATYSEGSRQLALADKVIEAPHSADREYDVQRDDTPYCDGEVYYDTSTATNERGEDVELEFWAVPIFDDSGDLKAVFEILDDRTEEVRRQESMEELVGEVTKTLEDVGAGNLSARARFQDEHDVIAEELLEIVATVNRTTTDFQELVRRVDAKATELAGSIEAAADSASRIDEQLSEQNASLEEVAQEMDGFSATMQEIAATSNEVASAADQALDAAEQGLESGKDARAVTDEVLATSEALEETVSELSERMDEINDVVEVISAVADKTNILALNANIEAARAGKEGSGFAVVANEVKELANETQSHTKEISNRIEEIQQRAVETVEGVEDSHENIQAVDEEIYQTVEALAEISEGIEMAASGIADVADANDEQARRVEDVTDLVITAQEEANRVTDTADEIVSETESQEEALAELSARVEELTDTDD